MSNEIQFGGNLSGQVGTNIQLPAFQSNGQADWSSKKYVDRTFDLTTGDLTLGLGDISTIGFVMFRNLDATNSIVIGSDGTLFPIKVTAGRSSGPIEWNAAAIHAKASAGTPKLQARIFST